MSGPQAEGEEDTHQHELVIIRRRGGGEEAPHKGGVWKIAHADFMTALMAFFLVMWLINATNEKTVAGVANYFNPMRLTDSATRPKGVFSMEPGGEHDGSDKGLPEPDKKTKSNSSQKSENRAASEAALMDDPYEELDKIAAQAEHAGNEETPSHKPGDAFRDPFDPDLRYEVPRPGDAGGPGAGRAGEVAGAGPPQSDAEPKPSRDEPADNEARELKQQIADTVKQSGFSVLPGIEVKSTEEGLLISISDQPDFEMFGISSARPTPELVVLMNKIGKLIAERPEKIVIRGHTDARQYRAGGYDNWRLSTARAQMAYYMLARSGVNEGNVSRIEGHADHALKTADNPLGAENRRIEVLLLKGRS